MYLIYTEHAFKFHAENPLGIEIYRADYLSTWYHDVYYVKREKPILIQMLGL